MTQLLILLIPRQLEMKSTFLHILLLDQLGERATDPLTQMKCLAITALRVEECNLFLSGEKTFYVQDHSSNDKSSSISVAVYFWKSTTKSEVTNGQKVFELYGVVTVRILSSPADHPVDHT